MVTCLALADFEVLIVGVDDRRSRTRRANEDDALTVGRQLRGTLTSDRVAGVEDNTTGNRTEEGQILERHLAGSVLTDRDTAMGSGELDVGERDGTHADLVRGTG